MNRIRVSVMWTTIAVAVVAIACRPDVDKKPWKSTDVWYHESDVALLATSGRPQLVEFFHPD
jgi:hypothetical protein